MEDTPIYDEEGKRVQSYAGTHCELDSELHVKSTNQFYRARHFSARNLCSEEHWTKSGNMCAGQGIIGPISDVQHSSQFSDFDFESDLPYLDEDEHWEDEEWDDEDWEDWLDEMEIENEMDEAMAEMEEEERLAELEQESHSGRRADGKGRMLSRRQLKRDKTNTSQSYEENPHNGTKGGQTSRSPSVGYENLFFFTDNEYFHTSRYEYLTQKEPQKGFVFGLIVRDVENAHFDVIGDGLNTTILNSYHKDKSQNKNMDLIDHAQDLKNFRVLKNLGSRIYNVSPFLNNND